MTEHVVKLWSALRPFAQGADSVRIKARNIRELFARLEADYPGMAPLIAQGIAVSVDGTLYRDSWDTELPLAPKCFCCHEFRADDLSGEYQTGHLENEWDVIRRVNNP